MAEYKSPNGNYIKGTLETLAGVALINGIDENGEPEHCGETEVWWDEQKTVERDGKPIYVDTEGFEWTFDQLTRIDEEETDDAEG